MDIVYIIVFAFLACLQSLYAAPPPKVTAPPRVEDQVKLSTNWVLANADQRGETYVDSNSVAYSAQFKGITVWATTVDREDQLVIVRWVVYQDGGLSVAIIAECTYTADHKQVQQVIHANAEELEWNTTNGLIWEKVLETIKKSRAGK